jgi:hypothetical protein
MQIHRILSRFALAGAAGLALSSFPSRLVADTVIDTFDTAASADTWSATWGTSPVLSWGTENSAGGTGSGSLRVSADYFTPAGDGWEQMVVTRTFDSPIQGSLFTAVAIDVKVDPSSVLNGDGNYGYFELKRTSDSSSMGGVNLTNTNWTTITFPIPATEGALNGIVIQNGSGTFKGPVIYYLDNFRFVSPPAPKTVIDTFDTADTADAWSATWGSSPVLSWDQQDAKGLATSGSLRVAADYFTPAGDGWEQMVITRTFTEPIVGSDYVSVSVDVKVDPSSVPNSDGNYGYFELKRTSDATSMGGVNLTSTNWTTLTFNIPATEGTLNGIINQNGSGTFQGPIIYNLDNFLFTKPATQNVPPTLTLAKNATPGLKLMTSHPTEGYQRQNVVYVPSEDLNNQLWWQNQTDPLTYSVTWADFPDKTAYTGFQGHIMLVTDTSGTTTPDWTDANVVMVEFQYVNTAGADGTNGTSDDVIMAQARLLHKVNEAGNNAMLYRTQANAADGPVGVLGQLRAPSMLGTWSISFRNNTTVTLTAPDGSTADFTIPAEDAALYEPTTKGVTASFGVQPNAVSRIGLSAVISHIKIVKGTKTVVDEDFSAAELNPDKWVVRALEPGGVFPAPASVAYFVSWPLPDTGFTLRTGSSVTGPWTTPFTPNLVGVKRMVLVNQSALPSAKAGFFQLKK